MAIYTKFCTYENIPLYGITHLGGMPFIYCGSGEAWKGVAAHPPHLWLSTLPHILQVVEGLEGLVVAC